MSDTPTVTNHFFTPGGKLYLIVSAGKGGGDMELVSATQAGRLCCLRSVCLGARKADTCAHASAAADYIAEHNPRPDTAPAAETSAEPSPSEQAA